MQFCKFIIFVVLVIKLVSGLPVSFEILNDLVNEQSLQHATEQPIQRTTQEPGQAATREMNQPQHTTTNKGRGSIFDEYVWLDNALQFIGDFSLDCSLKNTYLSKILALQICFKIT
jgi:hypothetical protein